MWLNICQTQIDVACQNVLVCVGHLQVDHQAKINTTNLKITVTTNIK